MDENQDRLSTAQGIHLCRLRDEYARPASYRAVALACFGLVAAATVPTPLYQLYREAFHFSDFVLTLVFGIYAFGVIPALLVFGPLGDAICRRRVLIVAICLAAAGIVVLSAARGVAWLLVALMLGSSIAVQLILGHLSSFRLQLLGMAGAIPGMIAIIAAWHYSSLTLMILGSVFCGASVGMAYLGSITAINQLAAPGERGSVNSLYFVVVYLFFSIPPIALGFAATRLGLHAAVDAFACLIALLTLLEMVWLIQRRRAVRQGSTGAASEKDDG